MSLRTKLLQDIENLSNKDEKPYAGIEQELENSARPTTDIGSAAFGIIKDSLSGAEADTIDGLKHRIHRLDKLKQHVAEAKLGTEEETLILVSLTKVENGLKKHLNQKRTIKSRSANVVSKMGSKLGEGLMTAMAGDPLATIAFKGAGLIKNFLQERKEKNEIKRATLRSDTQGMFSSTFSDAPSDPLGDMPKVKPSKMPESTPEFDEPSVFHEPGTSYNGQGEDVLETLREISKDVKSLVRYAESAQIAREGSAFDAAESASETGLGLGGKSTSDDKSSSKGEKGKGLIRNLIDDKFKGGIVSRVLWGLSKALLSSTGLLVAGIALAIVGGVRGWLKSKSWGVGKISGMLGGLLGGTASNTAVRMMGNMGKWALIGAGIGIPFGGPIGAAIGGLAGALIGGILGWIGGKNIARFFDDFGTWISESFGNGFDMMKNFFTGMWTNTRNMIDSVLNIVDTIKLTMLGWMKGIVDWLIDMDPTGLAGGALGGVSNALGGQQKNIQDRMDERSKNKTERTDAQTKREQDLIDKRNTQQVNEEEKQRQRDISDGISSPIAEGPTTQPSSNSGFPKEIKAEPSTKMGGGEAPVGHQGLGGLSANYESGKKGSEAVGYDSTGGTSFGKYQIASKNGGTMNKFMEYLQENNPEAHARLAAAGPADSGKNGKFAEEWKTLAKEGKLGDSEHDFIKKTHYDVGIKNLKNENLSKMIGNNKALQEVMWSTSVQHGGAGKGRGAADIFNKVYKEGMSEEDLIKAVYEDRGKRFGSSTPEVQQSVANRFKDEQQKALKMLKDPENSKVIKPEEIKPTAPIIQASATEAGAEIDPDTGEKYYPDQQFASAQQSQSLTPDGSAPITPANYNTVNQKSKDSAASAPVVNVSNNTSNNMSGGGGGSNMPNVQAANGVSSRQPTFSKAI